MEKKASILIADDNMSMCKTMSFVLGRKGYAVTTAKDGPEAIEKVKEIAFDRIFMDIKMPLMDGVETYRRIKKIRPEAMVVMMTAYAVEDLVQEALREGVYGIIRKPLDMETVIGLIEDRREANQAGPILVVDDDPEICVTLKALLTKRGYDVDIARTGEEAIAMQQSKPYDVMFIEIDLPTMNGLETYLAIKEISPHGVAVLMTADRQEVADLVDEALSSHAYGCIHKPLDVEEVLRLVDEIRDGKKKVG